jgi:hypothetical protein
MRPGRSNFEFFEKALRGHTKVASVRREGDQTYVIERHSHSPIKVFLTNSYVVGLAEYHEVRGEVSGLDAIVTISPYNSVSGDAWRAGQADGVGVFQFKEFYGALNYEGDSFVSYVPRDPRGCAR